MNSTNNILIGTNISVPNPFGVNRAFPLDARSFFTDMETALETVHDAIEVGVNENGEFTLPSEEDGGLDSVYYYGQPVFVVTNGGETAEAYVIVKRYDEDENPYGDLQLVNANLVAGFMNEEQVAALAGTMIDVYVGTNLNTECLDDYLFTSNAIGCGNSIPYQGMYAYGIREVNGKIELCEYAKRILAFDPDTTYDPNTNPLATIDSIKGRLKELSDIIQSKIDALSQQLSHKVDKIEGYGLSQNDFTDCLLDKLESLPYISLEGDMLIINGHTFKLTEWFEVFDYYIGWMNLKHRSDFSELTKEELLNAVTSRGTVPATGKLYGPGTACTFNTFFVMKRKHVNIDGNYKGEYSELNSNGLVSPIRTYISSMLPHRDVMINDMAYDVMGLLTHRRNSSDKIQIAFNVTVFDYYVGWMKINTRDDFYRKTKDELVANAQYGSFDGVSYVYEGEYGTNNLFYVMIKEGINFDSPADTGDVDNDVSVLISGVEHPVSSPIASRISSVMQHDTIEMNGVTYSVYGVHSYRPNAFDKVHIVFSK